MCLGGIGLRSWNTCACAARSVLEVHAEFLWPKISSMKSMSNVILAVDVRCHKLHGATEAFMDTLYSRPEASSSLFLEQTADKFAND